MENTKEICQYDEFTILYFYIYLPFQDVIFSFETNPLCLFSDSELGGKARYIGALLGLTGLAGFPYVTSRISKRLFFNTALALTITPFLYYIGNQLVRSYSPPPLIDKSNNFLLF